MRAVPSLRARGRGSDARGARRAGGGARARAAAGLTRDGRSVIAETAIVYPGTIVPDDCQILDYAVVGKQPTLSPRSTTKREELAATELGPGTIVSTGAIV